MNLGQNQNRTQGFHRLFLAPSDTWQHLPVGVGGVFSAIAHVTVFTNEPLAQAAQKGIGVSLVPKLNLRR